MLRFARRAAASAGLSHRGAGAGVDVDALYPYAFFCCVKSPRHPPTSHIAPSASLLHFSCPLVYSVCLLACCLPIHRTPLPSFHTCCPTTPHPHPLLTTHGPPTNSRPPTSNLQLTYPPTPAHPPPTHAHQPTPIHSPTHSVSLFCPLLVIASIGPIVLLRTCIHTHLQTYIHTSYTYIHHIHPHATHAYYIFTCTIFFCVSLKLICLLFCVRLGELSAWLYSNMRIARRVLVGE